MCGGEERFGLAYLHILAVTAILLARSVPPMEGEFVWQMAELASALPRVADGFGGLIPGGVCTHMLAEERCWLLWVDLRYWPIGRSYWWPLPVGVRARSSPITGVEVKHGRI